MFSLYTLYTIPASTHFFHPVWENLKATKLLSKTGQRCLTDTGEKNVPRIPKLTPQLISPYINLALTSLCIHVYGQCSFQ